MEKIRRAIPEEYVQLTDIACKAKQAQGFDDAYIRQFRTVYGLSPEYLHENEVFVLEQNKQVLGFYALHRKIGHEAELDYLFIDPGSQRRHFGRRLWHHLVNYCDSHGIEKFEWNINEHVEAFYYALGAKVIGERSSRLVRGSKLKRMEYHLRREVNEEVPLFLPTRDR